MGGINKIFLVHIGTYLLSYLLERECMSSARQAPNPLGYITPERFNSNKTMTMQIMLIRIPIGPLLIFDDGLNPRIGSALFANSSSISPIDFMISG